MNQQALLLDSIIRRKVEGGFEEELGHLKTSLPLSTGCWL